jgi:hypothetical protein
MSRLLRRLIKFLKRVFNVEDDPAPPKAGLLFLTVGDSMGSLNIAVVHPVLRDDGSTFDPLTELRGWRARTRVVGAQTWTNVGDLNPPSVTSREVNNVVPGSYEAEVTWEDIYGQVSDPATDSTDVPIPAKPAPGGLSLTFTP